MFDRHRFTVVSTDFIKSPKRADDFIVKCPEFVIVDEAHGCTLAAGAGRGRQQRFELLKRIADDRTRHILLVTATPHSGNEDAFRSLLGLLDPAFAALPTAGLEKMRRKLANHLVQRRRADIRRYLEVDTAFPQRKDKEATYKLGEDYRKLFDDILSFARDYVSVDERRQRRVRYWSALALLRCVSSSPAAAAATLRSRAAVDEADDVDEAGRRTVLDLGDEDDTAVLDFSPVRILRRRLPRPAANFLNSRGAPKICPPMPTASCGAPSAKSKRWSGTVFGPSSSAGSSIPRNTSLASYARRFPTRSRLRTSRAACRRPNGRCASKIWSNNPANMS